MIAPFLDYEVRTYNIRNGSQQTFTLPRRAMVTVGRFRRDDTGGGVVFCNYVDTVQDSDSTQIVLFASPQDGGVDPFYNQPSVGCYVFEAGRVLRIDAPDDCDITLHIFYLPTAP